MSTGPGRVMQHVLARAAGLGPDEWALSTELARELYGPEPTRSQESAVRRAIGRLADRGEVRTEHVIRGGRVWLAIRGEESPRA
jgi:hypothetical protein